MLQLCQILDHWQLFWGRYTVAHSPCHVELFMTPWTAACQASLSLTISWSLPKFMSIESVITSNNSILCSTLLLPPIFPRTRVFSKESAVCIRWPKYWSFSFSNSPSKEYLGVNFLQDWLAWSPCFPKDSQESFLATQ